MAEPDIGYVHSLKTYFVLSIIETFLFPIQAFVFLHSESLIVLQYFLLQFPIASFLIERFG
jgi:hypothetical protein